MRKLTLQRADVQPFLTREPIGGRFERPFQQRNAHFKGQEPGIGLVRGNGAGHEFHARQVQRLGHRRSQTQVADVYRIEGAAKDADGLGRVHG